MTQYVKIMHMQSKTIWSFFDDFESVNDHIANDIILVMFIINNKILIKEVEKKNETKNHK